MHIRFVEPRDAANTASLLNAIIATGTETSMFEPLSLANQQHFIATFPMRGVFLVAELEPGGPIIGMQSIEPHDPRRQQVRSTLLCALGLQDRWLARRPQPLPRAIHRPDPR